MATLPLHGKSAIVTGGARRIGREIALSLAKAGADVAITYLKSKNDAAHTVDDLARLLDAVDACRICIATTGVARQHGTDEATPLAPASEMRQLCTMHWRL